MFTATATPTLTPTLRRLSPVDLPAGRRFASRLAFEDVRFRFGIGLNNAARIAEKLFLLGRANSESYAGMDLDGDIAGIGNLVQTGPRQGEFALIIRADRKRKGYGSLLLYRLMLRARQKGIRTLSGWVLSDNSAMLALARKHGAVFARSLGSQIELLFNLGEEQLATSRVAGPRAPAAPVRPAFRPQSPPMERAA